MKKYAWYCLFGLAIAAGVVTVMAPSAQENCCKKVCHRGEPTEKAHCKKHADDYSCCKKEDCHKK